MRKLLHTTGLLTAGLLLSWNAAAAQKPNIILIMADDQAKQAIGCYGNKDIQTPGLDRLAQEGMRFEHALTPNSFCTPARAAVLTGKYSHKNGVIRLTWTRLCHLSFFLFVVVHLFPLTLRLGRQSTLAA